MRQTSANYGVSNLLCVGDAESAYGRQFTLDMDCLALLACRE